MVFLSILARKLSGNTQSGHPLTSYFSQYGFWGLITKDEKDVPLDYDDRPNDGNLTIEPHGRLAPIASGWATMRYLHDGDALVAEWNTGGP